MRKASGRTTTGLLRESEALWLHGSAAAPRNPAAWCTTTPVWLNVHGFLPRVCVVCSRALGYYLALQTVQADRVSGWVCSTATERCCSTALFAGHRLCILAGVMCNVAL